MIHLEGLAFNRKWNVKMKLYFRLWQHCISLGFNANSNRCRWTSLKLAGEQVPPMFENPYNFLNTYNKQKRWYIFFSWSNSLIKVFFTNRKKKPLISFFRKSLPHFSNASPWFKQQNISLKKKNLNTFYDFFPVSLEVAAENAECA